MTNPLYTKRVPQSSGLPSTERENSSGLTKTLISPYHTSGMTLNTHRTPDVLTKHNWGNKQAFYKRLLLIRLTPAIMSKVYFMCGSLVLELHVEWII